MFQNNYNHNVLANKPLTQDTKESSVDAKNINFTHC